MNPDVMVEPSPIIWRVENRVGHLVFNRPDAANALNSACGPVLADAIAEAARAAADGEIGAVLMSAQGRHFCAGGDIEEFVRRRADLDRLVGEMLDLMHPAIHALATLPLPVVSALQGPIGGAGIALALSADIVLASPAMKLRGGYSAIGLSPDLGASFQLVRRAGPARAKYILMSNRAIPAEQCLAWGLVDELHPPEALMAEARALAENLARGATQSLAGVKRLCDGAPGSDLHAHLALEREALVRAAGSEDGREGVGAFIDKRAPRFAGSARTAT